MTRWASVRGLARSDLRKAALFHLRKPIALPTRIAMMRIMIGICAD